MAAATLVPVRALAPASDALAPVVMAAAVAACGQAGAQRMSDSALQIATGMKAFAFNASPREE